MNKIISLQYLRAFACYCVLFVHVLQNLKIKPFGDYYISGGFGVDLFFILSGFLIYLTTKNDDNWKSFAVKRLFRIFPMYWFCLIFYFSWFAFHLDKNYTLIYCIQNFLMLPWTGPVDGNSLIIGVAWSTVYEVYFYTVFSLMIFFKINKKYIIGALFFLFLIFKTAYFFNILNLKENQIFNFLYSIAGYTHILPFVLGVLLAMVSGNFIISNFIRDFKFKKIVFVCINFIYFIILIRAYNPIISYLISTIIFFIWLNVEFVWNVNYNSVVSKFFVKMGDISFSIYFLHVLVINILISYFKITDLLLLSFLASVLTIAASIITFKYIETPFINLSRKIVRLLTNGNNK
jgi:exopolysaccharide production protein ExoZ